MGEDRVLFTLYEVTPIVEEEMTEHRIVAKIAMERSNVWPSIRMAMATAGLDYASEKLGTAFKYVA